MKWFTRTKPDDRLLQRIAKNTDALQSVNNYLSAILAVLEKREPPRFER